MCDNPPEVLNVVIRRARKAHRCHECGGTILPQEFYAFHHGVWADGPSSFKICQGCEEVRASVGGECYTYGDLREAITECGWHVDFLDHWFAKVEAAK